MKRVLTFLLVLLTTISIRAQHWTAIDNVEGLYPDETPVYVQVHVNDALLSDNSLEMAAFIDGPDGECRAVGKHITSRNGTKMISFNVKGNLDTDNGKPIYFKAFYKGVEYLMGEVAEFNGETYSPLPLIMELDLFGGLKLPATKFYEAYVYPFTFNLGNEVQMVYVDLQGNDVTPVGKSKVVSQFTYQWSTNGSSIISATSTPGEFAASMACENQKISVKAVDENGIVIGTAAETLVTIQGSMQFSFVEPIVLSRFYDTVVTLTADRNGFDPALVVVSSEGETVSVVCEPADGTGLKWNVRALNYGGGRLEVTYGNKPNAQASYKVKGELPLAKGWSWFAPTITNNNGEIAFSNIPFSNANGRIIEFRSQTDLLYNDPVEGVFGTIEKLAVSDGMYKVKTESSKDVYGYIDLGMEYTLASSVANQKVVSRRGYNWIGYYGDYIRKFKNVAYMFGTPSEGDRVVGKEGFAEYDGEEWLSSDAFLIEPGKGYMYYTMSPSGRALDFSEDAYSALDAEERVLNGIDKPAIEASAKSSGRAKDNVWQYDASLYSENMTIVAQIDGVSDCENITIGAFVNGECRGKGKFVKGNRMFINVAGQQGDKVTFKLYNHDTDTYYEVKQSLAYAPAAGSVSTPVTLTSDAETTGISNVETSNVKANVMYDLSGRRVNNAKAHGIYIVNGKKVAY